jgi:hypothetical protein
MKLLAILALTALPFAALAVQCDKIEYAEAKDWALPELETQACVAFDGMRSNFMLSADAAKGRGPLDPVARMYMDQSNVCQKQYELYIRILKNVHHKEPKPCK